MQNVPASLRGSYRKLAGSMHVVEQGLSVRYARIHPCVHTLGSLLALRWTTPQGHARSKNECRCRTDGVSTKTEHELAELASSLHAIRGRCVQVYLYASGGVRCDIAHVQDLYERFFLKGSSEDSWCYRESICIIIRPPDVGGSDDECNRVSQSSLFTYLIGSLVFRGSSFHRSCG